MIIGTADFENRDNLYSQTNNPTEEMLRKVDLGDGDKDHNWLETCGPTSAVNCIASQQHSVEISCPGKYSPQPEEVLSDYLNDPRNYRKFAAIRANTPADKWMGNRIPQFYPLAVLEVFGVNAEFGYNTCEDIIVGLRSGKAYQACLINPGHYIAMVGYDTVKKEFIFNDSWGNRKGLINKGFNERLPIEEFNSNCRPYGIFYSPL